MRQVMTKKGMRWRCIKSIQASRQFREKRQEFGAQTTAKNKANAQAKGFRIAAIERD
jgi:hypothetical protein